MRKVISPDIWESKRILITKLYKDEEWPLKQVIRLIQTPDFCPSETQLRSKLKKWHITKPSRKKYTSYNRGCDNSSLVEASKTSSPPYISYSGGDLEQTLLSVDQKPHDFESEQAITEASFAQEHFLGSLSNHDLPLHDISAKPCNCMPSTAYDGLDRIMSSPGPLKPSLNYTQEGIGHTTTSESKAIDSIFSWHINPIDFHMDSPNSRASKNLSGCNSETRPQPVEIAPMDPSIANYPLLSVGCNHRARPRLVKSLLPGCIGGLPPCKHTESHYSLETPTGSPRFTKKQKPEKQYEQKATSRATHLNTIIDQSNSSGFSSPDYQALSPYYVCPHSGLPLSNVGFLKPPYPHF